MSNEKAPKIGVLELHRETVLELTEQESEQVVGGIQAERPSKNPVACRLGDDAVGNPGRNPTAC